MSVSVLILFVDEPNALILFANVVVVDQFIQFALPEMSSAEDAAKAAASVMTAVSDGELTPSEGSHVRTESCPRSHANGVGLCSARERRKLARL